MKNTLVRASANANLKTQKAAVAGLCATQKVGKSEVGKRKSEIGSRKVESATKPVAKSKPVEKSKLEAKPPRAGSTPSTAAAVKKSTRKTAAQLGTAKTKTVKTASVKTSVASEKAAPAKSVRATKKRAPKDLAAQYGETEKVPRQKAIEKAPRKRRDATAKARQQSVIAPDDALLARLARAGAISSSLVPANIEVKPLRAPQKRRSRQWEAHCGKCGKNAFYRAAAALCAGCGAILVRE